MLSMRVRRRRTRLMLVSIAFAIWTAVAATGTVVASNPTRTFEVTACATPSGRNLILTVAWSGMPVSAWSYFVVTADGSGGIFEPVPQPADAGTLTQTFPGDDVSTIQSIEVTLFRSAGPNFVELDSATITQPAAGWPRCEPGNPG